MTTARINLSAALLALITAISGMAIAAPDVAAGNGNVAKAEAFIQNMAKDDFAAAESDFTATMKNAAPPGKLQATWQALLVQGGAFQNIAGTKTIGQGGYTSVIVNTQFKNQTVGLLVTFDSRGKIAGLHIVPPLQK